MLLIAAGAAIQTARWIDRSGARRVAGLRRVTLWLALAWAPIATVQAVDNDQLFVQTRTGLLGAIDVKTGQLQWWAALGNATATDSAWA